MTERPTAGRSGHSLYPRAWAGALELWPHDSHVLAGNPLGDPARRSVGIYRPPGGVTEGRPMLIHLAGFAGSGVSYAQPDGFLREGLVGLLDRGIVEHRFQPMSLVLPDCLTSLGGSQYVNSPAVGRYQDYLLQELLPELTERLRPSSVAIMGQSSGGFGALHLAMEAPGRFSAVGSSAGDMAFDLVYLPEFGRAARFLRAQGGPREFLRKLAATPSMAASPSDPGAPALALLAMGACYSPVGADGDFELPFDLESAELVPAVWDRWLRFDPVRRLANTEDRVALAGLRSIHLTASRGDEWGTDLAARRFVAVATSHGLSVLHQEFDGGHFMSAPRFEATLQRFSEMLGSTNVA